MSDLSSERHSLSALSYSDGLELILDIREKRRDGILAATQSRTKKDGVSRVITSAKKTVAKLSKEDTVNLLAKLLEMDD